jgi:hypothetical protein
MKLLINCPINALSFGNVSVNILKALHRKNVDICFFPIGDKTQLEAFDKTEKDFIEYLKESSSRRFHKITKDLPTLKIWHIHGSETRHTPCQSLFTFHETSELTEIEKNLLMLQDNVFVSSNYTKNIFEMNGVENVHFTPLGFDTDFCDTGKEYLPEKTHFGLMGKFEQRKNTARIIKTWLKVFGNNPKYLLSCAITNPFLDNATLQNEFVKITEGKNYNNLNIVPYMQTNSDVNDFINSIDIDLTGLSGGEGWNLPAFNSTALGKWSVVMNATAHKDWATKENSILIEPSKLKDCYDGVFFKQGNAFNQGQFFDITDEEMESAILDSATYAKKPNPEGLKLQNKFTYDGTVETILNAINKS